MGEVGVEMKEVQVTGQGKVLVCPHPPLHLLLGLHRVLQVLPELPTFFFLASIFLSTARKDSCPLLQPCPVLPGSRLKGSDVGPGRLAVFRGASTQKDMETTLLRVPEKSCTRRPHLQPRSCLCTPDPLTHRLPDFFWGALQGTSSPLCPPLCYSPNLALSWHSLTSISQFKPDSSPPGTSLPKAQTQPISRSWRAPCSDGQSSHGSCFPCCHLSLGFLVLTFSPARCLPTPCSAAAGSGLTALPITPPLLQILPGSHNKAPRSCPLLPSLLSLGQPSSALCSSHTLSLTDPDPCVLRPATGLLHMLSWASNALFSPSPRC